MNVTRGSNLWLTAFLKCAVLITAAIWIYYPSLLGQAVWDDGTEIFKNTWITQNSLSWRILISPSGPDYQPLKTTLEWILYHTGHGSLIVFHSTSLILHLISGILIWKITSRFSTTYSWLAGLLFIIHPLSVSSVSWIAELKNTFSLPLLLLAVDAFIVRESHSESEINFNFRAFSFFSLSLLCKSSGVLFPGFMFLYYYWKNRCITKKNLKELFIYSSIALLLGLITLKLQITEALPTASSQINNLHHSILSAIPVLGAYFLHFVWPFSLGPIYQNALTSTTCILGCVYLSTSIWFFLSNKISLKTTGLFLLIAGLFLLPVIGILPMSFLLISQVGDHLSYISLAFWCSCSVIAFNFLTTWLKVKFNVKHELLTYVASALIAFYFINESRNYAQSYTNSLRLWTRATAVTPNSWFCLNNLGEAQLTNHDATSAVNTLSKATRLNPSNSEILINLSEAYFQVHDLTQAIICANKAVSIEPTSASAHYNLANAQAASGELYQAVIEYKEAEKLEPQTAEFHYNHALALSELGLVNASKSEFETCIRLNPRAIEAYINLAILHASLSEWRDATQCYSQALNLDPHLFEANYGYADILMALNSPNEAILYYNRALSIQPDHPGALEGLKRAKSASLSH